MICAAICNSVMPSIQLPTFMMYPVSPVTTPLSMMSAKSVGR
jgi:hypothetical protein